MNIRQYLENNKLITDGSFGTYYSQKFATDQMPELANISNGEQVLTIHKEYIQSGAKLIRTNTFASNTVLLSCDMQAVKANINSAIKIAKQAVAETEKDILIAGDIGPIPDSDSLTADEQTEQYYEIAKTFLENGINILTFETFPDMDKIQPAIEKIKQDSDVFVMVQFCVNQFGYSNSGQSAGRLIANASQLECVDAVGLNCGVGPAHMEKILETLKHRNVKYIIAIPNAGYPKLMRNRVVFDNDPKYFAQKLSDIAVLGVDILGGCCGTSPEFIKEVSDVIDINQISEKEINDFGVDSEKDSVKRSFFRNADGSVKSKKLVAVELAPPLNADDEKLLQAAEILKGCDVDVLTFPDSPSGRTRTDSVLTALKIKRETGLDVMPHICCRDKNAIAMRSLFLGAKMNGINDFLIITGDPIPSMARQSIKSVFNFDSTGLMRIAQDMNEDMFCDSQLCYGGAINQGRNKLEFEIKRVKKKLACGAEFFLTQPVFSQEDADRVRYIKEQTGARILCGIMPLVSRKNALFMKNEISGIHISDEVVERYAENATREQGEQTGIEIAAEMISYTKDFADGYYFSFPFNRVHMLEKILDKIDL
ncbi:MAG: bifunctional homocysteine S-methyltransferase/methylenetetrahydrofolate reductase [Ruminococcus sp.]|nr:bifunctional homocysteine S-methyltransferase/methylenetetrahydrofolate reductase [Ruminococcus sp.]